MRNYHPMDSFDESSAKIYDDDPRGDELATVARLHDLARGGPALELAIGTGRIAVPLAATGIRVDGVDLSAPMVAKLRAKPGGADLEVTMGDFADVPVEGSYRLIYIVFNTLFNLLTQDDQVRCFENVTRHLTHHGVFVVEAFTPHWLSGCGMTSTSTPSGSPSIMSGWTWPATTRWRNSSTKVTCGCPRKACRSSRLPSATPGRASST